MSTNSDFKRVIFFDFTGTLFDPFVNIRSILNSVAREKGYKYYNETELENVSKVPPIALLNKFLVPDADKKAVVKDVLLRLENEIQHIPPIPGIKNMLFTLRAQGCYLGILSSNSQDNITKWLLANNLDIFHDVTCIPFQETKTPHLQAIKSKFTDINEFIFVSDEAKDLKQAHAAEFLPIGVLWGFDNLISLQQENPVATLAKPKDFKETYLTEC
jgi:phosphoglycolate phosphatase